MIPVSNEFSESLSDDNQIVRPKVLAWMSDLRSLENLKVHSSSHTYEKQILDRNPQMYVKFDKTNYAAAKEISDCLIIWTSYGGPLSIQSPSHGLSAGDEVVFTTNLSAGLPYESSTGSIKAGELNFANSYYVQNPSTHYFQINTNRANAIANSSSGRVIRYNGGLTIGLAGITVTVGPRAIFTYNGHGHANGDAIVLYSSATIPGGLQAKTDSNFPIYYIQNATANTFNLNTNYYNAINGLAEGLVETTNSGSGTLYSWSIHRVANKIEGGHRIKDYGSQAFDIAIGTSDASTPIYDTSLTRTYHYTFQNHIEVLEPNRLIDTFNKGISASLLNTYGAVGTPAVFTYNSHGLSPGTPIVFDDVGSLTGVSTNTTYFAQIINANSFYINTDYYNALNNISSGRVAAGGTSSYILFNIYNSRNIGSFTKSGSIDATDSDMQYYSWSSSSKKWSSVNNKLTFLSGIYDNNSYYVYTNVNSLDHFVDFQVDSGRGRNIYARFIDENNHVVLSYTTPVAGYPIQIGAVVDGVSTNIALIDPGVLSAFDTTHYYRFEAKYNVYSLYDMGTSEPTNTTSGTLIGSGYFDHPVLRTDDAKKCGLGFSNQIGYSPMANPDSLYCEYNYFAAYGYNSLSNLFYFDYDNTTASKKKYLYSSTSLSAAKSSQFQALNNVSNFSYSFYLYKQSVANGKSTIFWLGNQSQETAIRISYVESTNDYLNVTINSETTTYSLNSTTLTNNVLYHIAIIKNGTRLSIYVNNVEVAYTTLPAAFALKDIVTGETPYIMFGADYAGTTLGDPSGYHLAAYTYVSEFAAFDYALSQADLDAMYYSVANAATLASETVNDYCNAECIIDGQQEETFTFAFANMLNKWGTEIRATNSIYSPNPIESTTNKTNIEDNYGWMSRVRSGVSGSFSNPDFIQLTFDTANCNKIFVSTGYFNGRIDSFDYILTKSDNSTITGSKSFAGASYVYISQSDLGLIENEYITVKSIKITPTDTVNPYDYARLFSVNPIWEVDLSDYVISFNVDKIRDNYDASLPIGATAANNGSIIFDNTDRIFNIFGDTLYGKYANPDVPFFISLTHELTKYDTTEDIVLANYMYADTWSFANSSMTVEVSLRDYSKYLQEKTTEGYVGQGISAGRGINDLMLAAGFPRRKIIFVDKYDEAVASSNPLLYFPFNDTEQEIIDSGGRFSGFESGYKLYAYLAGLELGGSLLYSESVDVQDESQRKSIGSVQSSFEPYYRQGSVRSAYDIYGLPWGDLFGSSTDSWTTEIFHYVDLDNFSAVNTEITLMQNTNYFSTPDNYRLYFEVSNDEVTYTWGFYDTSNIEHRLVSDAFDASRPHQIIVRKTGGSPNEFELFVDGVLQQSMSPSVTIATINSYDVNFTINPVNHETFVSNFSVYDYAIPDADIESHYVSSSISLVPTYRYLYASDETYWDAMLNIATADLGMFYIDEYGDFRYEYRNFIHQNIFDRYQNSQYTFSDDVNIIGGNYINEIQTNKVSVSVKRVTVTATSTSQLWSPSDGESLVTGTVAAQVTPESTKILLGTTTDPYWIPVGYVKIDDEIIKYNNIDGNYLSGLERGYFGTSVSWHPLGSLARECRYYTASYSSKPAAEVKYPLITNTNVEIDRFTANANNAELIISVKSDAAKDSLFLLSGTNDLTGIIYGFSIAGVPVSSGSSEEVVVDVASEYLSNIRKYGVKELKIDNPFIQNKSYAKIVGDHILGYYKEPVRVLEAEVLAVPQLQLGDLITISQFYDLGIVNKKYWVISNSISYDGGIKQNLSLRSWSATIDPPEFTFGAVLATPPPVSGEQYFYPSSGN